MALELTGTVPTWINGVPNIPAENVDVGVTRPTKRRKGAFGITGLQRGQADPTIKITMPTQAQRDEFVTGVHDILDDDAAAFRFEWQVDGVRNVAVGCVISEDSMSSNNDGDGNRSITIIPTTAKRLA